MSPETASAEWGDNLWARWPAARPALGVRAEFKTEPEDFRVTELAEPEADADGEHLYLLLEKRNLTTTAVAASLARSLAVGQGAIGYAGMKDKRAVTRQWFSVPAAAAADFRLAPAEEPDTAVAELARLRGRRKLRRGAHAGNAFEIRLRSPAGAGLDALESRLGEIAASGAPNYFGAQRFGADNLPRAIAWLPRRRRERDAFRRGLHLSVLRSFLFNTVLAARITADDWSLADASGPLWGRGRPQPDADREALEAEAVAPFTEIREALEHAGLSQERRPLVLRPQDFEWTWDGADLCLAFTLLPGGYATSVLRELLDVE
ncbi:MAG: tRNA pseudouridine(13) synthase TruD [Pseudomonadota bacterium]